MTYFVGLTGGIGSGKSTVANLFVLRAVPVIDADDIARRLTAPGQPAHQPIIDLFGKGILGENQAIDRKKLRIRVFADRDRRLPIPFGPFLCVAGLIAALWGDDITLVYLQYARIVP